MGGSGRSDETWTYDFNTDTWRDVNPSSKPSERWGHALAYDAESDLIVLFGGNGFGEDSRSDETWSYDFNANTWTNMEPSVEPSKRGGTAVAYDSESDRVVLFGGGDFVGGNTVLFDETWAYDFNANTWTDDLTPTTPTPDLLISPLVIAIGIGAGVAAVAAVAALLILRSRGKRKGEG